MADGAPLIYNLATMKFVETHAHLSLDQFDDDRDRVIKRARRAGVDKIVEVGINIDSSAQALELAKKHEHIFATCGIHPNNGQKDLEDNEWEEKLAALAVQPKVVAIGECGLDYYRQGTDKKDQQVLLVKQLELANELDMPVVIHCRNAWQDLFAILTTFPETRGIFHCWSGSYREAETAVNYNFLFGFGGLLTYENTENIAEVAQALPVWRIVLETDSPFMPPEPMRGKRNEPANLVYIAKKIAQIREIKPEDLVRATFRNAKRLLALP